MSLTNNLDNLIAIKEISKYSVKSSDYLTGDSEKDSEIVNDLEKAHSITAIWNFEKQNYYLKDLKR
ncbi:hypothetical protein BUZ07_11990 [Staphylococcus gallinarum]|nr:hypothetical protein BUZ07_11990 [Staphylococcus gallinarum]